MKYFTVLFPAILLLFSPFGKTTSRQFYLFCDSHSMPQRGSQATPVGMEEIRYTDVQEVMIEEDSMKTLARQWADLVNQSCPTADGCTSDLNYYLTRDAADKRLKDLLHKYADSSHFQLKRVHFEPIITKAND